GNLLGIRRGGGGSGGQLGGGHARAKSPGKVAGEGVPSFERDFGEKKVQQPPVGSVDGARASQLPPGSDEQAQGSGGVRAAQSPLGGGADLRLVGALPAGVEGTRRLGSPKWGPGRKQPNSHEAPPVPSRRP